MANAMNNESEWIPLMEYAMKSGVSLSTLRRHIKGNKIPYKIENGRYLLRNPDRVTSAAATAPGTTGAPLAGGPSAEVIELRTKLRRAQEEITELKMLVALYEEQLAKKNNRPNSARMNG